MRPSIDHNLVDGEVVILKFIRIDASTAAQITYCRLKPCLRLETRAELGRIGPDPPQPRSRLLAVGPEETRHWRGDQQPGLPSRPSPERLVGGLGSSRVIGILISQCIPGGPNLWKLYLTMDNILHKYLFLLYMYLKKKMQIFAIPS